MVDKRYWYVTHEEPLPYSTFGSMILHLEYEEFHIKIELSCLELERTFSKKSLVQYHLRNMNDELRKKLFPFTIALHKEK